MTAEEIGRLVADGWIGLALLCGLLTILIVLDAIMTRLLGPDPDLREPWDPRR